ncbi:SEC10/PgrA surface exclusion domain-containing protein [Fructilactobacillus frigidiflavus]|uniref:SEC10/PgrA surface exclusion domain-containing protein n=1 Tax=Fructilactobacillus frigidiflavus TaxID=3242688 RepID=UPI0037571274
MERKQRYKLIKTKHAWVRVAAATTFMVGGLVIGGNSVFADTNVTPTTQVAEQTSTNPNQAQIDQDNQAINSDKNQIADNNSKIAADQSQVAAQTQKVNDANADYDKAATEINKHAADTTAQAQQTTSALENKEKAAATTDIQNQIDASQNQKHATDAQAADTQGKLKDVDSQISSLQNQPNTNPNQLQIANSNVPGGYSTLDKDKSLLQNTAQDNLWNPAVKDPTQPNNGNGVADMIYVTPDNDKSQRIPNGVVNYYGDKYKPLFEIDQVNPQTGMTDQQKEELAIMLMNTLNNTREARGLQPMTMTTDKYDRAQVRAAQPSAENITHTKSDIISAFGSDQYENLAYFDADGMNSISMMDLYYNALQSMMSMMNDDADSNWGHRENYLMDGKWDGAFGFKLLSNGFYDFTFDFNYDPNASSKTNMMDRIKQYADMGPINSTATDNSAKIAQLQSQRSQLQGQLAQLQQKSASLQSQINKLNGEKANVSFDGAKLSQADQNAYNDAQSTIKNTAATQAAQLQSAQATRDGKANDAQAAINSLNTEIAGLQAQNTALQNDITAKQQAINNLENAGKDTPSNPVTHGDNTGHNGDTPSNPVNPSDNGGKDTPVTPNDNGGKDTPVTPSNTGHNGNVTPTPGDNTGHNGDTPATPSDNGSKDTPATPVTPNDNGGKATPTTPVTPSDNGGKDTPTTPVTPNDNGGKNTSATPVTPVTPVTPNDNGSKDTPVNPSNTGHNGVVTPANNAKPSDTKPATSDNMGHNGPVASDNGSQTTAESASTNNKVSQVTDQPAGRHFSDDTNTTTVADDNYVPRHAAKADNQDNALPQTGQSSNAGLTISGILAVLASLLLGLGSFFKFRKEN